MKINSKETRCPSTEESKTHELIELVGELRQEFKAVHIPRSTYYYAKEHRGRDLGDSQIIQAIDELRQQDLKYTRKYGYRQITDALHDYGFKINHKWDLRSMREHNWLCRSFNRQKQKYNSYKGTVGVIAPNRRFNGGVLAFNISFDHPTVEFAVNPLKEALNQIPVLNYRTTVHTDQGFQYQYRHWQNVLKDHRAFHSTSCKATCLDNAAMELFSPIIKVEVMNKQFETKAALSKAMTEWVAFYNHRRIKTKLNGKSPVKYRELTDQKAA